jgi:endonuclease/exonuclease/phosphatase family metal-dependent hydrolase
MRSKRSITEPKVFKEGGLMFLDWNIGGAKYLELKGGPPLFREPDINDPVAFVNKVFNSDDPLCRYLKERLGPSQSQLLKRAQGDAASTPTKRLLAKMNGLLKVKDLYNVQRFKHVRLSGESRQWISLSNSKKSDLHEHRRIRFNRCLLKDAFPEINTTPETRDEFQDRLQEAFSVLLRDNTPDIITLQEVVRYEAAGKRDIADNVLRPPEGYDYFPHWLVDTDRHSHQGKWNKVREQGEWSNEAFFAQGNAILVRKDIPHFRIYDLPDVEVTQADLGAGEDERGHIEYVALESGIYFGDRNTEPRAAMVAHVVLSSIGEHKLRKPLDIFVLNVHLTTLSLEREGIPDIDERAAQTRQQQLDIVLNGIVSRYNQWRRQGYRIRDKKTEPKKGIETHDRHSPIWIIAGDFNCIPESIEYQTMVRRGFIDLVINKGSGTKAAGLGNEPTITLDYVFAGPRFEAIDPTYAGAHIGNNKVEVNQTTKVSDHFPLIVRVPIALAEP